MISIPFGLTEEMVRTSFLDAIASMPNAPLDAPAKSRIEKIEKIHTLCRVYDFDYQAAWSATSIWEHKENYTEYTTEMVFVDNYGNESKYKLSDNYKGPVPKTVPVTKTKIVRDAVEQTSGSVSGSTREFMVSATTNTLSWVLSLFSNNEILNEAKEIEDETATKWDATPELEARKQVLQSEETKIRSQCSEEVPGNHYKDLRVNLVENNYELTEVWLPLIKITFKYEGAEYCLLLKGSKTTEVSQMFFLSYPTDQFIVDKATHAEEDHKNLKSKKTKSLIISIVLFFISFCTLSFHNNIVKILATLLFLGSGAFFLYKFFGYRKSIKAFEQKQNDIASERSSVRNAVAEIMKRTDLTEEEKQNEINCILKQ